MGQIINRRRVMGGKKLPYDAEIEYLESSGTQYIDTGIIGTNNYKVEIKTRTKGDTTRALFGSRIYYPLSRAFSLFALTPTTLDKAQFCYGGTNYNIEVSKNTDHIFILDKNKAYVDDSNVYDFEPGIFTSPSSFLICSCHTGYSGIDVDSRCFVGLIYYCKIWNNETLVRDFIPVRIGTTGYLYDKVSKQLFGNAGTGGFILGPDK